MRLKALAAACRLDVTVNVKLSGRIRRRVVIISIIRNSRIGTIISALLIYSYVAKGVSYGCLNGRVVGEKLY